MAVASVLVVLAITLATRPFLTYKARGFAVLHTWLEITNDVVSLHVSLFWKLILGTVGVASLPFWILTALPRERQTCLRFLRVELEKLIWEREDIEERFSRVVRERKMLEFMLTELEDDYDKTHTRLELLEELPIGEAENLRLKENLGKDVWDIKGLQDEHGSNGRLYPDADAMEALLQKLSTQKGAATNNSESLS